MVKRKRASARGGRRGHRPDERTNYAEVVKENVNLESYYNALAIVPEEEREAFWAALRRELPISFRFAGSKGHALAVKQRLLDYYVPEIVAVTFDGALVEPPRPVKWYPEELAWSMTTPKTIIRKFAPFKSFQKFLVSETSVGNISRQELVSMIPPLLMDVKPGMTVLDMCAAPGSKSAQLVEMIHGGEEARVRRLARRIAREQGRELSPDGQEIEAENTQADLEDDYVDDGRSTGLLIANDADYKRAQMLVHQVKRLNSPNLIVMNHDATMFPSIQLPSEAGRPKKYLKFDRILADVPCSGDGTCRKNPKIWDDWTPGNGLGLHSIQVRILVRALQMLKVGGRVVYSTCSMNPVENEAVLATAIDRCGGTSKVELLDCSDALPGLVRRPGLESWKIMDKNKRIWSSWENVENEIKNGSSTGLERLTEGMFPPAAGSAEEIPFERCFRIYPHLQDTGGFFIAVLQKLSEIRARPESEPKKTNTEPTWVPAVNEIEAQTVLNGNPIISTNTPALDVLALKVDPDDDMDTGNQPAAARQNAENVHQPTESKKRPLEEDDEQQPAIKRTMTDSKPSKATPRHTEQPMKRKSNQPFEESFKYLDADHQDISRIFEFYQISSRFPRDRFMVRNASGQAVKAIYYTSTLARHILNQNEGKGMKFVHCGIKMFVKQDSQGRDICQWRIQSEGLPIVEAWTGEDRVVRLHKRETLRKLLIEMFPKVAHGAWNDLGEIGERVRDIRMGCCILRVEPGDAEDGFRERLVLPLWRGISSLNLMLPKEERKALLLRLYNDDSPLVDFSKERLKNTTTAKHSPTPEVELGSDSKNSTNLVKDEEPLIDFSDDEIKPDISEMDRIVDDSNADVKEEGGIMAEDEITQTEDTTEAAALHEADQVREVAPGVIDEEDTFNTTF